MNRATITALALAPLIMLMVSPAVAIWVCSPNVDRATMVLHAERGGTLLPSLAREQRAAVQIDCDFKVVAPTQEKPGDLQIELLGGACMATKWARVVEKGTQRQLGWTPLPEKMPMRCHGGF